MVKYKKIIFVSLVITILIFSAGLLLGLALDNSRTSDIVNNLNQNELDRDSYLVEQDFIRNVNGNICDLSKPRINALSLELGKLGQLITRYEPKGILTASEYEFLKRKYFLSEIKTYTLFTNVKRECKDDFNTIIFFYDQNDQESLNQGYILDSLVKSNDNVHVFSFDRNFNEPALETLKIYYNITKSPTLIINNVKKDELVSLEGLKNITK